MAEDDVVEALVIGVLSEFFEEDVGEGFARGVDQGDGVGFDQVRISRGTFLTGVFDFKFEPFPGAGADHGGVGGDFGDLDIAGFEFWHGFWMGKREKGN